ncbi:hypothetical protein HJG53_07065 [Sphingomonas sp. ID1715]|uniref:DUF6127 family protein n=1 Tax=Sphingomonas sp. ID1715 TaxID=1656898 RepID=UPI0014883C58|nr:DUF6127 family protein [Sphingomonas sp. ID1715]NNM76658.1 hypothetical protein [Sphingomonas sp. ID1715]
MSQDGLLASLLAQAEGEGASVATLRGVIEEASELGARRALASLGLEDASAGVDVRELRSLLGAWRDAKKSAVQAVAGWFVRLLLALLLVGIAVKTGLWERLG